MKRQQSDPLPPLEPMRYGMRPARFTDTGERFNIATIDGRPVALEPSTNAFNEWARRMHMEIVTREQLRAFQRDSIRHRDDWPARLARWLVRK